MFYINAFTLGACEDTRSNTRRYYSEYWATGQEILVNWRPQTVGYFLITLFVNVRWDIHPHHLEYKNSPQQPKLHIWNKLHLVGRVETFKIPFIWCLAVFYVPRVMLLTIGYIWSCPVVVTILFSVHRPFYVWHFLKRTRPTVYGYLKSVLDHSFIST